MRRIVLILALLAAGSLVVFGQAASGSGGSYEVRAIFDNGGFLVSGEDVRVAGANVGSVGSVDVTAPGEWANRDHSANPGKAVVVLNIADAGFHNFLQDASCLIRPQSLLGEKYVDCQPTQPRAPGVQAPPPLTVIPSGQPGAGQHFLPLQNNGKEVDLDLVNNIMREPYADRFRLILNDLGAGLAARGKTLDAIIKRADPALRQTDRVLAELASENQTLSNLAANSDKDLTALARVRQHVSGFINNANTAGQATAERSADLEAGLQKFPAALHALRLEMVQLKQFSDQATPVFAEFRAGAPGITRATKALGPFAHAATPALTSLGTAAAKSQGPLVASDPIIKKVRDLAKKAAPGAKSLNTLLGSLRKTGGYKQLTKFLFNTTGAINGFDKFGHFLRATAIITSCTGLSPTVQPFCDSHWGFAPAHGKAATAALAARAQKVAEQAAKQAGASAKTGGTSAPAATGSSGGSTATGGAAIPPGQPLDAEGQPAGGTTTTTTTPATPSGPGGFSMGALRDLLNTMIGPPSHKGGQR
jgi:phospholipid/cholesterol/gamma-HCH transport system substrate-binding protein